MRGLRTARAVLLIAFYVSVSVELAASREITVISGRIDTVRREFGEPEAVGAILSRRSDFVLVAAVVPELRNDPQSKIFSRVDLLYLGRAESRKLDFEGNSFASSDHCRESGQRTIFDFERFRQGIEDAVVIRAAEHIGGCSPGVDEIKAYRRSVAGGYLPLSITQLTIFK